MYTITFIEDDGTCHTLEASDGQTVAEVATQNGVTGIVAECGGARVCGTCHCYIDAPWRITIGTPDDEETMMLEFSENHRPDSRLGCQIKISKALDGLVVRLPATQP
jgi:ferredoxin, 2Fe-2S